MNRVERVERRGDEYVMIPGRRENSSWLPEGERTERSQLKFPWSIFLGEAGRTRCRVTV